MILPQPVVMLLTASRLEQVPADPVSAQLRLTRAEEKLETARKIAAIDHMLSLGYRVRAIAAAHEAVGTYAEAMINSPSTSEYQRIRRRRNKSEYDDTTVGRAELTTDLSHAAAIIHAVRAVLRRTRQRSGGQGRQRATETKWV